MPSAPTHDLITIVSGAIATPIALNSDLPDMNPTNAVVFLGAYLVSGLLFSPDLDLHSSPYKRWRKVRWIWLPYQKMVPHRSWISHNMVFGPVLRVLYFVCVMALLTLGALAMLNLLTPIDPTGTLLRVSEQVGTWVEQHPAVIAYAAAGFVLAAAVHTLADIVTTGVKRRI